MTSSSLSDCLFCKIVAGEIPAKQVLQTDYVTAFHDINPQAPVHVLVIPNTHTPGISDTPNTAVLGQVMAGVREAASQLGLTDYRVVINNGAEAGQTVFHLHAHILGGRPFTWPPG